MLDYAIFSGLMQCLAVLILSGAVTFWWLRSF